MDINGHITFAIIFLIASTTAFPVDRYISRRAAAVIGLIFIGLSIWQVVIGINLHLQK